jgi:alpha/beta hydrolase fold
MATARKDRRRVPVIRTTPRDLVVGAGVGDGMSISKGTGNSPLTQADLVYARVGGTSLRLDLYTPAGTTSGLPTLLYLHGGGWAVGDKSDAAVERLMPIVASGFAVASVNYRLVPSVSYPAPVHDVKAAGAVVACECRQVRAGSGPDRDRWLFRGWAPRLTGGADSR